MRVGANQFNKEQTYRSIGLQKRGGINIASGKLSIDNLPKGGPKAGGQAFAESGTERAAMRFPRVQGPAAIIAGSCSRATLGQIEHFVKADKPFFRVEIGSLLAGRERVIGQALAWAKPRMDLNHC